VLSSTVRPSLSGKPLQRREQVGEPIHFPLADLLQLGDLVDVAAVGAKCRGARPPRRSTA